MVLIHVFLSAGGDDRRVLLWHMEQAIHSRSKPVKLKGEHLSNIFCLAFDSTNKKVFSGGKRKKNYMWSSLWGNKFMCECKFDRKNL